MVLFGGPLLFLWVLNDARRLSQEIQRFTTQVEAWNEESDLRLRTAEGMIVAEAGGERAPLQFSRGQALDLSHYRYGLFVKNVWLFAEFHNVSFQGNDHQGWFTPHGWFIEPLALSTVVVTGGSFTSSREVTIRGSSFMFRVMCSSSSNIPFAPKLPFATTKGNCLATLRSTSDPLIWQERWPKVTDYSNASLGSFAVLLAVLLFHAVLVWQCAWGCRQKSRLACHKT